MKMIRGRRYKTKDGTTYLVTAVRDREVDVIYKGPYLEAIEQKSCWLISSCVADRILKSRIQELKDA